MVVTTAILVRKLASTTHLTDEQRGLLLQLTGETRRLKRGEHVVRVGDQPKECTLILEGLLCRDGHTVDGTRQIMSFQLAGDMPDLQSLFVPTMDHNLTAASGCHILCIPHEQMRKVIDAHPSIRDALFRDALIEAAVFREWIMNLGGRNPRARVAHLFCEVLTRMKAVGLAEGNTCALPLQQTDLADATGISPIHLNRTLQELREYKLIEFRESSLAILDWERLKKAGQFKPDYLHVRQPSA